MPVHRMPAWLVVLGVGVVLGLIIGAAWLLVALLWRWLA